MSVSERALGNALCWPTPLACLYSITIQTDSMFRNKPRVDGDTWIIDIKRSDGVSRPEWNGGIAIKRHNGS